MTLQGVQQTLLLEMGYFQQEIICSLWVGNYCLEVIRSLPSK